MSLQQMVDHIAARLGRSVLVEDRRQLTVAYSPQTDAIDDVRRDSILRRQAGADVSSWLRGLGVHNSREAIRVPGNETLHMLPRICVPVWRSQWPLGYLWLIDEGGSMGLDEMRLATDLAGQLAEEWHNENLHADQVAARQEAAVRELLLGGAEASRRAAIELTDGTAFDRDAQVTAYVVLPQVSRMSAAGEELKDRIQRTLRTAERSLGSGNGLHHGRTDHGVLLVASHPGMSRPLTSEDIAGRLRAAATRWLSPLVEVESVVIGVGSVVGGLTKAQDTYSAAVLAARTSATFGLGDIAFWERLGAYRALDTMVSAGLRPHDIHPGIGNLANEKDGSALLETLECYLDVGGHAQAAATRLNLHRTSMYYRLERIQRLLPADLQDGNVRLSLHLATKLARATGLGESSFDSRPSTAEAVATFVQ